MICIYFCYSLCLCFKAINIIKKKNLARVYIRGNIIKNHVSAHNSNVDTNCNDRRNNLHSIQWWLFAYSAWLPENRLFGNQLKTLKKTP